MGTLEKKDGAVLRAAAGPPLRMRAAVETACEVLLREKEVRCD